MYSVWLFVLFALISEYSVSGEQLTIQKWNICPSIIETRLPVTCSSYLKTFNSSSDLVDHFVEIYLKLFSERGSIDEVFDTSIPAPVMGRLMFDVIANDGKRLGISNPEDGANLSAESTHDTFAKFTPNMYAKFLGQAAGQYLLSEGVLTEHNTAMLAETFVESLIGALDEKPATYLHGLLNGVVGFFTPIGLYTPEKWDTWHFHAIYTKYKFAGMA